MSRVEDDRYVHHTYKDRGQILSIKVEHCRYMDHTHKLSGSSIVDICIIQVSYMNGSGLMLIDTCIIHTYTRVKYHRIIRQSVTKFQLYHRYIYVSQIYAFCIPASKILASRTRIIDICIIHTLTRVRDHIHPTYIRITDIYIRDTCIICTWSRIQDQ